MSHNSSLGHFLLVKEVVHAAGEGLEESEDIYNNLKSSLGHCGCAFETVPNFSLPVSMYCQVVHSARLRYRSQIYRCEAQTPVQHQSSFISHQTTDLEETDEDIEDKSPQVSEYQT